MKTNDFIIIIIIIIVLIFTAVDDARFMNLSLIDVEKVWSWNHCSFIDWYLCLIHHYIINQEPFSWLLKTITIKFYELDVLLIPQSYVPLFALFKYEVTIFNVNICNVESIYLIGLFFAVFQRVSKGKQKFNIDLKPYRE